MSRVQRLLVILSLALGLVAPASAQTPPAYTFALNETGIKFPPGARAGSGVLTLKLTGTAADQTCDLQVWPVPVPNPPMIDLTSAHEQISAEPGVRRWQVTITVRSMPVMAEPMPRQLKVKYCGASDIVSYKLDNIFAAAFSWSVTALKPQRWDGMSPLPITVAVGPRGATAVRFLAPQLVAGGYQAIEPAFLLCATRDDMCDGAPLALAANTVQDIWLRRAKNAIGPSAGTYSGTFRLVAAEKPEGDSFDVTFYVSDPSVRWLGALFIFLGVALSYGLVQWLRRAADISAYRLPVELLRRELAQVRAGVNAAVSKLEDFNKSNNGSLEITALPGAITYAESGLDEIGKYLPSGWRFWAKPPEAVGTGSYQDFLTVNSSRVGSLAIIYRQGILQVMAEARQGRPADELSVIAGALKQTDAIANADLANLDQVAGLVRAELKAMTDKLAPLLNARAVASDAEAPAVSYSVERLNLQIAIFNLAGWAIFALMTSLFGVYILILNDPDFGQCTDLLLCFAWGAGLPTAGEALTKLTPAGVGQSLGMNVTRTPG